MKPQNEQSWETGVLFISKVHLDMHGDPEDISLPLKKKMFLGDVTKLINSFFPVYPAKLII